MTADKQQLRPLTPLAPDWPGVRIDTDVPHVARVYDYFLGGKDHFRADREAAELILRGNPDMRQICRQQRAYLRRVVRFLAEEAGIRQFLDIGTGLPTAENTHQVAQSIDPDARVAYVDNDPIVLAHARVLMSDEAGHTTFVDADVRAPSKLLADPGLRGLIDFTQPVAVLIIGLLHFLPDHDRPAEIVETLLDAVPAGSYLAVSHGTADMAPDIARATASAYQHSSMPCQIRGRAEVLSFFDGLELVDPGLAPLAQWRPEDPAESAAYVHQIAYAAVGRKR